MLDREFIGEVTSWIDRNFGPDGLDVRSELAVVLGLMEEAGEVARPVVKMNQGIRGTREEWMQKLREEIGDVFIKLCDVADFYEFDLTDVVKARFKDVSQRDWVKDRKGHGVGE